MDSIVDYIELAAALSSLAAWSQIRKSKYLRWYPLLLWMVVAVEVYVNYFLPPGKPNAPIYNWQIPIQHILYLIILYFAMEARPFRQLMLYMILAVIAFAFISGRFLTSPGHFNVLAYCFGCLCMIIGIIIKFFEMLQNPTEFNFLKQPFFYMLFAYLLFILGTLPYFAMGNWLYSVKEYRYMEIALANVMSILNYILYSTYTIAFLWMILKKDSY